MGQSQPKRGLINNKDGFTLIETIAMLVIIGVLVSIATKRVMAVEVSAVQQSFTLAISELNTRESLTWSLTKISDSNWVDDLQLFASTDYDLDDFSWSSRTASGGILNYRGQQIVLDRAPSTNSASGRWKMK